MTTDARITLALAACQGLSDSELQARGAGGFKAMILRKRKYANAARFLDVASSKLLKRAQEAEAKLATVTAKYDELLADQMGDGDASAELAKQLISGIANKS